VEIFQLLLIRLRETIQAFESELEPPGAQTRPPAKLSSFGCEIFCIGWNAIRFSSGTWSRISIESLQMPWTYQSIAEEKLIGNSRRIKGTQRPRRSKLHRAHQLVNKHQEVQA
jgi:hypothetical protein